MTILTMIPLTLWAQDNTWERPEVDEQEEVENKKSKVDEKYLRGAVPLVDGRVVFSKKIEAPGKSADDIYNIVRQYMEKVTKEKNQLNSRLVIEDADKHEVAGTYEEWLVFKSNAIFLDRTRFHFVLSAKCMDGSCELTMTRIRYIYDEYRNRQDIKAEDWITDKECVNKKNTHLYPQTGKFRRKTIDRKDYLFDKIESLLK